MAEDSGHHDLKTEKLGLNDGCARPYVQLGYINGVCYANIGNTSVVFLPSDPITGNGLVNVYFTALNCAGPSQYIPNYNQFSSMCQMNPDNSTYTYQYFAPPPAITSVTSAPTSPLPAGVEVYCFQASLTEYVIDSITGAYATASGTGTSTLEAFPANSVNMTFVLNVTNKFRWHLPRDRG